MSLRNDNPFFLNIFVYQYKVGFEFGSSSSGITQRFSISNAGLDAVATGILISGNLTTGQISNCYSHGDGGPTVGVHGIFVTASNTRIQISNLHISWVDTNGIRIEGNGSIMMLENLWVEYWNRSSVGFPAVDVLPGNTAYIGRSRLFENGGGGGSTGGGGSIVIDA